MGHQNFIDTIFYLYFGSICAYKESERERGAEFKNILKYETIAYIACSFYYILNFLEI